MAPAEQRNAAYSLTPLPTRFLKEANKAKPFESVVQGAPADILLVVVGGEPIYGDANVLAELLPGAPLETISVCGSQKAIYLGNSAAAIRG